MVKVLFVCHGNICRSVMAEFIMKDIVTKEDIDNEFIIDSKACSSEEIGSEIYRSARSKLLEKGVKLYPHYASKFTSSDYDKYDYIFCMDKNNIRLLNLIKPDTLNKYQLLLPVEIADPWYTNDFETTYEQLVEGINLFLKKLKS